METMRQISPAPGFIRYREDLKQSFRENHPYVSLEMSDDELNMWILESPFMMEVSRLADMLADCLLANGLVEVQV